MDRRQVRLEVRRRAILDAAAAEFARVGFERATLDEIGAQVGLSKAGLYHYVESKEQLLGHLLADVVAEIEHRADELTPAGSSAAVRLGAFVTAHVEIGVATPSGQVLAHHLELILTSETAAEHRRRHQAALELILEDGIRTGEFRAMAVGPAVHMLFAALNSIPRWFDPAGPLDIGSLMGHATDLFLAGISNVDLGGER